MSDETHSRDFCSSALLPDLDPAFSKPVDGRRTYTASDNYRSYTTNSRTVIVLAALPPQLTDVIVLGNATFQFMFSNLTGANFTVFASANVAWPLNTWSNLGPAVKPRPACSNSPTRKLPITRCVSTRSSRLDKEARNPKLKAQGKFQELIGSFRLVFF